MLKISYAGHLGLSPAVLAQFTFKMCVAARNSEKFTKTAYFGSSKWFKVIDVDTLMKLVISACYD